MRFYSQIFLLISPLYLHSVPLTDFWSPTRLSLGPSPWYPKYWPHLLSAGFSNQRWFLRICCFCQPRRIFCLLFRCLPVFHLGAWTAPLHREAPGRYFLIPPYLCGHRVYRG